jgi:methylated-DNA-[protein]-cysteine S-methyltransferase
MDELTAALTETALGWAGVALSAAGIRRATLFHRSRAAAAGELAAYGGREGDDARAEAVLGALRAYAEGDGAELEAFPVDPPAGGLLESRVWLALREIPCGETRSYGWLARRIGAGESPRAVGTAVGANPIPLWLPCHRVIGSDGSLAGFGGGLAMKRMLLELEGALPKALL